MAEEIAKQACTAKKLKDEVWEGKLEKKQLQDKLALYEKDIEQVGTECCCCYW